MQARLQQSKKKNTESHVLFFYGDYFLLILAPFWHPFGGEISLFYINAALGIHVPGVPGTRSGIPNRNAQKWKRSPIANEQV